MPKGVQIVDGPVEARKAAREQLDHGADWIKVYMTHRSWVDTAGRAGLAAHAHRGGAARRSWTRRTAGATRWPATPTTASGCSARWTAAATRSSTASKSTTRRRADGQAGHVVLPDADPVLLTTGRRPTRRRASATASASSVHGASFQKALKAGVKIVFGTDVGGFPWTRAHRAGVPAHGRARHVAAWTRSARATSAPRRCWA